MSALSLSNEQLITELHQRLNTNQLERLKPFLFLHADTTIAYYLLQKPYQKNELIKLTKLSKTTIHDAIVRLQSLGLICQNNRFEWQIIVRKTELTFK